jgi:shikimate kinase
MGSGKTTVGKKLARILGRELIDTDERIEYESGMTIPAIFKDTDKGESWFRERERSALNAALGGTGRIVSCGGGMVIDDGNRALLREKAIVVWLFIDTPTVLVRIADDPQRRPLLDVPRAVERTEHLVWMRTRLYAETADLVVDATAYTPDELAELLAEELGRL